MNGEVTPTIRIALKETGWVLCRPALYFSAMKRRMVIGAGITAVVLVLCALFLPAGVRQWREYEFRSLTSIQHYDEAQILLHPQTKISRNTRIRTDEFGASQFYSVVPFASGVNEAIRHMEAITPEFPKGYQWAVEVLPYLQVERDRPQDLHTMLEAKYQACSAKIRTALEAEDAKRGTCGSGIIDPKTGKCLHIVCGNYIFKSCFQTDLRLFTMLQTIHQPPPDGFGQSPY